MAREYFKAFHSYLESIEPLSDAERGRLFTAMLEYSISGKVPDLQGNERFVFPTMRANLDREIARYAENAETNRTNGAKGGRPKKTEKTKPVFEKPKSFKKSQDKDKDKDICDDDGDMRARAISHIVEEYEQNIGVVPRVVGDDIAWWLGEGMQEELIVLCIREAAARNARSWQYIRTMLQNCMSKGVMTAAAYEGQRRKKAANSNPFLAMIGGDGNDT